jgi:hypothetical protein
MAATLQEIGAGHITTIDLEVVRAEEPIIEQLYISDACNSNHIFTGQILF